MPERRSARYGRDRVVAKWQHTTCLSHFPCLESADAFDAVASALMSLSFPRMRRVGSPLNWKLPREIDQMKVRLKTRRFRLSKPAPLAIVRSKAAELIKRVLSGLERQANSPSLACIASRKRRASPSCSSRPLSAGDGGGRGE